MFLLSNNLIKRYIDRKQMRIDPFESQNLLSTYYYFRLGPKATIVDREHPENERLVDVEKANGLTLRPREMANVSSLEVFQIPDDVFAIIGNPTHFPVRRGLVLLHGPTIDPGYHAPLELTIYNMGPLPAQLAFGERIGKLIFFDVSDTALEEVTKSDDAAAREQRWGRSRYDWLSDDPDEDRPRR